MWTLFAALLLLLTTGCDADTYSHRRAPLDVGAGDVFTLVLTAVAVAVVTYLVVARRGRAAIEPGARRPALFRFVVIAVSTVGMLACGAALGGDVGRAGRRILQSVAAIAWGSFLLLQLLAVLDRRPSLWVARAGALFAVLQVPLLVADDWLPEEIGWVSRLGWSFALLAVAATHATFLATREVRVGQRWLVRTALVGVAVLVTAALAALWWGFRWPVDGLGRVVGVTYVLTATFTILAEVCARGDRPVDESVPPPPEPGDGGAPGA